jgi:hypothetical protein
VLLHAICLVLRLVLFAKICSLIVLPHFLGRHVYFSIHLNMGMDVENAEY